jgi:sugar fermentation stimulation protein A
MANRVVQWLLTKQAIPGLENANILRHEVAFGRSRFDFLLEKDGKPFLLEVKSCTLFENDIALFPDAVTDRGRRHLLELAEKARRGIPGGVVILINWPGVRYFLPDYHTDPEFARTFLEVRNDITFIPVAVSWNEDLSLAPKVRPATIPWELIEREAGDCGSYILILHLESDRTIAVGMLGSRHFHRGYYLYVGSAKKNLARRIERHLRKRKHFHWHIDYLRDRADSVSALAIRSREHLECTLANALRDIAHWTVPGFGSSDCGCETHLFGMTQDPANDAAFIDILQYFRIGRLGKQLHSQAGSPEFKE